MRQISRHAIYICLALLICSGACKQPPPPANEGSTSAAVYRRHAEFEPTAAVWLLWPNYDHRRDMSNEQTTMDIIKALAPYVQIKLVVPNDTVGERAKALLSTNGLDSARVSLYALPYREFWARDMGPAFVSDGKGGLAMADFNFNAWGYADTTDALARLDEKLDERIAALAGIPILSSSLITEGGDHEVNGKGVMIATESVEMTRNPGMTREQIAAEFRRLLGVHKVIWLPAGLREDDHTFAGVLKDEQGRPHYTVLTTNGHSDEYARFADASTILLAQADSGALRHPIEAENARRLEAAYQILKNATDQDGRPFRIVRVPLPKITVGLMRPGDAVYDYISTFKYRDGSIFPKGKPIRVIAAASYLNFLIANDCVLAPYYWKKGLDPAIKARDEAAHAILQSVFPGKKIIPINALPVNYGGGGIHCITQNEPEGRR